MRYRLLYDHSDYLGETRAFDGIQLYLPYKLQQQVRVTTKVPEEERLNTPVNETFTHFLLSAAHSLSINSTHRWSRDYSHCATCEIC
jgi:hypothetical protein